jgi:hypothetical protein
MDIECTILVDFIKESSRCLELNISKEAEKVEEYINNTNLLLPECI